MNKFISKIRACCSETKQKSFRSQLLTLTVCFNCVCIESITRALQNHQNIASLQPAVCLFIMTVNTTVWLCMPSHQMLRKDQIDSSEKTTRYWHKSHYIIAAITILLSVSLFEGEAAQTDNEESDYARIGLNLVTLFIFQFLLGATAATPLLQ